MHAASSLTAALILLLLIASAFDLHRRRIPNRLLAAWLLIALVLHLASGRPASLVTDYLAGFAVGLLMFLPLYLKGGMAAGDVKLMATVGAFIGPSLVFFSSLATYCVGGVLALAIVCAKGRGRAAFANVRALLRPMFWRLTGVRLADEITPADSVGGMPYAVAIMLGTLLVLYLHHS